MKLLRLMLLSFVVMSHVQLLAQPELRQFCRDCDDDDDCGCGCGCGCGK